MQSEQPNIYEQVFACWLAENHIPFAPVDQTKRFRAWNKSAAAQAARMSFPRRRESSDMIKNFDFLIRPDSPSPLLAEVKGRTFHGTSLAGLKGLDGWVTFEDVAALSYWLDCFQKDKPRATAVFVFIFRLEKVDVELDGLAAYHFDHERFLLLAIPLEQYRECMKPRSPKWQTVTAPADDFRRWAAPAEKLIKNNL
jgi:hypothetical protein